MNYDFTLDRKGMFSVLASSVLMAALLFVAGLIVGSYWTASGPTASAAAKRNTSTTDNDLNAAAQGPVLLSDLPQLNLVPGNKTTAPLAAGGAGPAALPPGQTQPLAAAPPAAGGAAPV